MAMRHSMPHQPVDRSPPAPAGKLQGEATSASDMPLFPDRCATLRPEPKRKATGRHDADPYQPPVVSSRPQNPAEAAIARMNGA